MSALTGATGDVILRIAREFAAARSQLAVGPRLGPSLPGSLFDHLAVHTLNALTGNIDRQGGVLLAEEAPLADWPGPPADPVAEAGVAKQRLDYAGDRFRHLGSDPEGLAEALVLGGRYPLEVLVVLGADPLFTSTAPDRFVQALEKVPLVVSITSMPDDTAVAADWIFPSSHFLESWDVDVNPPGVPFPVVSLAEPVAEDVPGDGRPAAEIFIALAANIDKTVAAALPWQSQEQIARAECEGLFAARRGAIMGTEFDEAWVRMMERAGWWAPGYRSAVELRRGMQETGGWWDPFYDHSDWSRVLRTDSGRFEFRADLLADLGQRKSEQLSVTDHDEGSEPLLALVLFEPLPVSGGVGAELPFLQGLLDPALEEGWGSWAEIHPSTARRLQVEDRAWVRVSSDFGSVEARARVTPRVVEGVVAMPVGLGKRAGGRWASGVGANPLRLLSPARGPVSGLPEPEATRVRVAEVRHHDGSMRGEG